MKVVRFLEVGHDRKTWFTELPLTGDLDRDAMIIAGEAKKSAPLASKGVDVWFENETTGFITAGIRTVGKFEIVHHCSYCS